MSALLQSKFGLAEYKRNVWHALVPAGTPPEALADPAYWAHNAASVKAFEVIEAREEAGRYWMQLLIVRVEKEAIYTRPFNIVDLREQAQPAGSPYIVKERGPRRWSVLRASDKAVLKENMSTEAEALAEVERLSGIKIAA